MRKVLISALMIACLGLTACGSDEQQLEQARSRLTQAETLTLTAQLQANFGETAERFLLEHSYAADTWTVTVTEPAVLQGVTARMTEHGSELEYDGAILTTGAVMGNGLSPIGAVPLIWETLRIGTVDSVWTEGALLVAKLIYDDNISVTIWLEDGLPVGAELAENNIVKVVCTITNVRIKEATERGTTENANLGGNQPGESGA